MTTISPETTEIPDWLASMKFCHVLDFEGDPNVALCGKAFDPSVELCDGDYDGEAMCESCGRPTCPRCAQLYDLERRL